MADPLTTSIRFTQPTIGGDSGTWPTLLNSNWGYADRAINQSVTVSIADTNVTLIADGSGSDQARYLRYVFTGALTADRTVTLPANVKLGWASNNTTGGKSVILSAGGTTLSLTDTSWTFFFCDGTNVFTPTVRFGTLNVTTALTAPAGASGSQVVNFSQFTLTGTNPISQALPGGLIIKSGSVVVTLTAPGGGALNFAVAFPSAVVSVVLSNGDAGGGGTSAAPVLQGAASVSSFTFTFPGAGAATVRLNWIAVGY